MNDQEQECKNCYHTRAMHVVRMPPNRTSSEPDIGCCRVDYPCLKWVAPEKKAQPVKA